MFDPQKLIGMTYDDANALAESYGILIRVKINNNNALFGTCDYRPERVNIAIQDGIVTNILNFG